MPNSLMDMFGGGFTPYDVGGRPARNLGFGDQLASRSNSLIGLGLGLMSGSPQDPYGNALRGYAAGSAADRSSYQNAQDLAERRAARRQTQSNFERTFARGDVTDAQRAMRDVLGDDATPEQKSTFMKQYYLPKTEGDWQITKLPHPTIPGDEITIDRNKRTGETRLPQYPGIAAPSAIPSSPSQAAPGGYRWGDVNPQTGRREQVPIEGGPATKLPEGAASKLAMLEAAKPGLEEAKKYFLDPRPLISREGGDQAGGALYSMGKQYLGEKTGSFEIGRQRRNVRYGIEAALRAATGAAAPEQEVDRYTDMYAPSVQDSYATRKQKIEALERFISTYEEAATRGHGPSKPAATTPSGGVRRYNPETGKIE